MNKHYYEYFETLINLTNTVSILICLKNITFYTVTTLYNDNAIFTCKVNNYSNYFEVLEKT